MPPTNLAELVQAAAKQEQERIASQIAEANERLVSVAYDKAATYTTVIIFGGYAGLFAIWQLTREYLTKEQSLWSALLGRVNTTSAHVVSAATLRRWRSLQNSSGVSSTACPSSAATSA